MARMHCEYVVHGGAETVTDQLAGTIAEVVPQGANKVAIAVVNNTSLLSKFSCRVGSREVARASFCPFDASGVSNQMVWHSRACRPGDKVDLELVAGAASTSCVYVMFS